ncbi:hypothetical protein [Streptomyces sp. NPDC008150]|uniref:hypothetical protein n=1 Tax=Streptomyces sp. NPDC008150 TaxID=3364816 RepID=UPI0036ED8F2A
MFILPAVILVGWVPVWWVSRRLRWILLAGAGVVCVFFVVAGRDANARMPDPPAGCAPLFACMDYSAVDVIVSGLLGLVCCLVLVVLTLVGELVVHVRRRASA